LAVPPALLLLTAPLAAVVTGGSPGDVNWAALGRSTEFAGLPVLLYWVANLIFFGLGEEVGWRGFLQPHLELSRAPVTAAGVVGIPWALWHLPLFGITPSYRAMPLIGFIGFALSIWVASWIVAWLLQLGGGSLFVVVVFHAWFYIVQLTARTTTVADRHGSCGHRRWARRPPPAPELPRPDRTGRLEASAQMPKEADSENDLR
jgi:membrane protease YdiL (CAAX protease family)